MLKNENEADDEFAFVVVKLCPRWRVSIARDHSQWLVQYRSTLDLQRRRGVWSNRRFCVTSRALRRDVRELVPDADPEALRLLDHLPAHASETRPPLRVWDAVGSRPVLVDEN
ncbi:hypothetical protein [Xanthobacter sp.]|uniref:hypothetical protein n=1 Tax=Xanthobacter sp. TaxID=35809 RepID=UPI0025CE1D48|nr:hypothetical protein [Xanthobacter sp.]